MRPWPPPLDLVEKLSKRAILGLELLIARGEFVERQVQKN